MKPDELGFFDREAGYSVLERALPHWAQAGTLCFVTWRAADALPQSVLTRLDAEIAIVLQSTGLDASTDWKSELARRSFQQRANVQWQLFATRDKFCDQGYGACLLSQFGLGEFVESSLLHFDGDRYVLTDAVIMPNHVHYLAAFRDEESFLKQNEDWKRYTAREINRRSKRSGAYWQVDQFDHLIRSEQDFSNYREYISNNPVSACLASSQYRHYQKPL